MASRGSSSLARIFGSGKKGEGGPSPQVAIQKLRDTEEMLNKKSDYLEKKIQEQTALAKKHGMKNKKAALAALARKKRLEKQLQQIDGTLSTVEFQREAVENAHTNTEVLKNMGYAAKAMKAAHQHLDVDDVHDLLDDIQEQNDIATEVSDALTQPVGFDQMVDEDDLLKELEEMEDESISARLMSGTATINLDDLPSVPTGLPAEKSTRTKTREDDSDMRQLAAWAS